MRGVLLDIEGTTTPISFVYEQLFPFARERMESFLAIHPDACTLLKAEHAKDLFSQPWKSALDYAISLMAADRKSTALKNIQGEIWQQGYGRKELRGAVFPDVPPAFAEWHGAGVDIRIYSSGSVLAQKLLFSTTAAGDLTKFLSGYFDTTTGPKAESASYMKIAAVFGLAPSDILFISDVVVELDAARAAGMRTLLCIRPGNRVQPPSMHPTISGFDEIRLDRSLLQE